MENPANPYIYKGALDPEENQPVCVPRSKQVNKMIAGIRKGEYWAVIGPRQIGKTTFLRQVEKTYPQAYYIYIDLEVSPSENDQFYRFLIDEFRKRIPSHKKNDINQDWEIGYSPELNFLNFLEKFKPKDDKKKIIFLFDEIGKLSFVSSFLHIWRKVFNERYYKKELNRYSVILTGSTNPVTLTKGANSPFNIAETYYIEDFSEEESLELIEKPLEMVKIKIEPAAKEGLISRTSGYPQLLQHLCYLLVERASAGDKVIKETDLKETIPVLFTRNTVLETLKQQIKINNVLEELLRDILNGEKKLYFPNQEFSFVGTGPIIERTPYCEIRNQIYEEFIKGILGDIKDKTISPAGKKLLKLQEKIQTDLARIIEYEERLPYEDNFLSTHMYEEQLNQMKKVLENHSTEYHQLKKQTRRDYKELKDDIENLLEKLSLKVDKIVLLIHQKKILYHFLRDETAHIISDPLKMIRVDTLHDIETIILSYNSDEIEERTIHKLLSPTQYLVKHIKQGHISLSHHALLKEIKRFADAVSEVKNVDSKFLLHLPIISLILSNKKDFNSETVDIERDLEELGNRWNVLLEKVKKINHLKNK